jgi:hypothetical protein
MIIHHPATERLKGRRVAVDDACMSRLVAATVLYAAGNAGLVVAAVHVLT